MYQHPGIVGTSCVPTSRYSTAGCRAWLEAVHTVQLLYFKEEVILHDEFNVDHVRFILLIMVNNTASVVFYNMCSLCVHCVKKQLI